MNFFIGAFHDAILHYGDALNKTLSQGGDVLDGYTISRHMWNKTFIGMTDIVFWSSTQETSVYSGKETNVFWRLKDIQSDDDAVG